jgi:hypothetical protein
MAKKVNLKEDSIVVVESNFDRTIVVYVRKVALTLHEFTCHEGIEYQKKVIEKCLKQPFL